MRHADTDVRQQEGDEPHDDTQARASRRSRAWAGERLGEWQRTELRVARGFAECRGLNTEQLEDIYQETVVALLTRPYGSEEHLRNALRHGIKNRALNMHRDTRRRTQILSQSAPSMQRVEEGRASQAGPEESTLIAQDRMIVREFLTELDELEQRVFWLTAEGMRYRAIASALQIPVNQARNASRSCERKRQRFQLLYDTGRLCGYRAATIKALQGGEVASNELAARAFAHLDGCSSCRAEHKTNANRLGRTFREQLSAVLPLPALFARLASLRHPLTGTIASGGVRERVAGTVGAAGAGAKLTAGAVTAAVIAGGTIGATHALEHAGPARRRSSIPGAGTGRQTPVQQEPLRMRQDARVHRGTSRPRGGHMARDARQRAAYDEFAPRPAPVVSGAATQASEPSVRVARDTAAREFGIEQAGP
jgi:RNA polymerase sigma factor (sigma-70 family)